MGIPGRYPATMNVGPTADPRSPRPKRWQGLGGNKVCHSEILNCALHKTFDLVRGIRMMRLCCSAT
jgi:hypothetical protein